MAAINSRVIVGALSFFIATTIDAATVRAPGPQQANDASHAYFSELLEHLLTNTQFELVSVPHPGNQQRAVRLLAENSTYDVLWSGRTQLRDDRLKVVPVPLFKGGLGIRGLVIRKDRHEQFRTLRDIDGLKEHVICQGTNWPDADILADSGLHILRVASLEQQFEMVERRRCDALALSIFEGPGELALVQTQYPDLMFAEDVLITYTLTMNFYVHKQNQALYETLYNGLVDMMASGEFERFMRDQPLTQAAFPLQRYHTAVKIDIGRDLDPSLTKWGFNWHDHH